MNDFYVRICEKIQTWLHGYDLKLKSVIKHLILWSDLHFIIFLKRVSNGSK